MLRTKNYILVPMGLSHVDLVYKLLQGVDAPFWPFTLEPISAFKKRFESLGSWSEQFARLLVLDQSENLIGLINWFKTAPYSDALEIGALVFKNENRNCGVMSETLPKTIDYLFRSKRVNRLQVGVVPRNERSIHLAKKIGFKEEGTLREFFLLRGRDEDVTILSILREEFFLRNKEQ